MKRLLVLSVLIALCASPAALACPQQAAMKTSEGHECPAAMKGVERTVTNLNDGVRLEMTSTDPEVVRALQAKITSDPKAAGCCKDCPLANEAWTRKVEHTKNGLVLTLTAGSPEEVRKIQAAAETMAKGGCTHMKAGDPKECPHHAKHHAEKA